jgi:pimeloyl-ACP methyl ester carboxylesterase
MRYRLKSKLFIITCVCLLLQNTSLVFGQNASTPKNKLVKYELLTTYDADKIKKITSEELGYFLTGATIPYQEFEGKLAIPRNKVKLYKITYNSVIPEMNNKPTIATGLIAIPENATNGTPVMSYQHGTIFGKDEVPSIPDSSMETKLMIAQFAAQGYILIAADYFGLGKDSKLPNSYFVRGSTEQACMDLYKAAMTVLEKEKIKPGNFFINGWSQGGYNTMLFLRTLENAGINVTAAATASAPVDPFFFINRGMHNPRPNDAIYEAASLSNLIFAFEEYYDIKGFSKMAINSKYYKTARDFYDFKIDWFRYRKDATDSLKYLLSTEFFESGKKATSKFWRMMDASEAYRWISPTPLRAYSGGQDEAVPEYLAKYAVEYQQAMGKTNGATFSAGPKADHRNTYIYELIDAKPWFDSFNK